MGVIDILVATIDCIMTCNGTGKGKENLSGDFVLLLRRIHTSSILFGFTAMIEIEKYGPDVSEAIVLYSKMSALSCQMSRVECGMTQGF